MPSVRRLRNVTLSNIKSPDVAPMVFKLFKANNRPEAEESDYLEFGEYFNIRLFEDGTWILMKV